MDKKGWEDQKKLYAVKRGLELCLILYAVGYVFGGDIFDRAIPVFLAILTVLAGVLSYLNHKLPPGQRMKTKLSVSSFGIHPYVTFAVLLIYDLLFALSAPAK